MILMYCGKVRTYTEDESNNFGPIWKRIVAKICLRIKYFLQPAGHHVEVTRLMKFVEETRALEHWCIFCCSSNENPKTKTGRYCRYSKTCVKRLLSKIPKIGFQSKKGGKDQDSIQSSTTLDPRYHMGK